MTLAQAVKKPKPRQEKTRKKRDFPETFWKLSGNFATQ
jgi:hypothetical protein